MSKHTITITECCNAPLLFDAWASLNPTTMRYEVEQVFDHTVCSMCSQETPETKTAERWTGHNNDN